MAEAYARRALNGRAGTFVVSSSGLMQGGRSVPDEVLHLLGNQGIDMSGHVSRQFDATIIANADLILGMERRHLTEIVAIDADAYRKTFTLPEFVHRLDLLELDPTQPATLAEILDQIAQDRTRRDLLRVTIDQEVPDPMGKSTKTFERVAKQIDEMIQFMVANVWPEPEPTVAGVH